MKENLGFVLEWKRLCKDEERKRSVEQTHNYEISTLLASTRMPFNFSYGPASNKEQDRGWFSKTLEWVHTWGDEWREDHSERGGEVRLGEDSVLILTKLE